MSTNEVFVTHSGSQVVISSCVDSVLQDSSRSVLLQSALLLPGGEFVLDVLDHDNWSITIWDCDEAAWWLRSTFSADVVDHVIDWCEDGSALPEGPFGESVPNVLTLLRKIAWGSWLLRFAPVPSTEYPASVEVSVLMGELVELIEQLPVSFDPRSLTASLLVYSAVEFAQACQDHVSGKVVIPEPGWALVAKAMPILQSALPDEHPDADFFDDVAILVEEWSGETAAGVEDDLCAPAFRGYAMSAGGQSGILTRDVSWLNVPPRTVSWAGKPVVCSALEMPDSLSVSVSVIAVRGAREPRLVASFLPVTHAAHSALSVPPIDLELDSESSLYEGYTNLPLGISLGETHEVVVHMGSSPTVTKIDDVAQAQAREVLNASATSDALTFSFVAQDITLR